MSKYNLIKKKKKNIYIYIYIIYIYIYVYIYIYIYGVEMAKPVVIECYFYF